LEHRGRKLEVWRNIITLSSIGPSWLISSFNFGNFILTMGCSSVTSFTSKQVLRHLGLDLSISLPPLCQQVGRLLKGISHLYGFKFLLKLKFKNTLAFLKPNTDLSLVAERATDILLSLDSPRFACEAVLFAALAADFSRRLVALPLLSIFFKFASKSSRREA
jgi:hypothetical protein